MSESSVDLAEPEPPSPSDRIDYKTELFNLHDRLQGNDRHVRFVNHERNIDIRLFECVQNAEKLYGITAELAGRPAQTYRTLDADSRFVLEETVTNAIDETSLELAVDNDVALPAKDTVALMNHVPVIFEPYQHTMLKGEWIDKRQRTLQIESYDIADYHHQRLLLGGLATLLTFLDEQP